MAPRPMVVSWAMYEALPSLDLALLARYAERLDQPRALREYRDALRAGTG